MYVITPKDQVVRIGRTNYADVRINDPTISRVHSQIEFSGGEFRLWDLGSKFGTLLLLKKGQTFKKSLCLQVGNKIYKLESMPSGIHERTLAYL